MHSLFQRWHLNNVGPTWICVIGSTVPVAETDTVRPPRLAATVGTPMKASGFLDTACSLKNPNFALMAEAMGVRGIRIEKPQELEESIAAALVHRGPGIGRRGECQAGACDAARGKSGSGPIISGCSR